jgi:hypothetical protein
VKDTLTPTRAEIIKLINDVVLQAAETGGWVETSLPPLMTAIDDMRLRLDNCENETAAALTELSEYYQKVLVATEQAGHAATMEKIVASRRSWRLERTLRETLPYLSCLDTAGARAIYNEAQAALAQEDK